LEKGNLKDWNWYVSEFNVNVVP